MELSSATLKNSLGHFLRRYHLLVFTISILGGLSVCMLLLNGIIIKSGDTTGYTPTAAPASFDKDTMQRIKELHTSTDNASDDLNLSSGRTNPFVE